MGRAAIFEQNYWNSSVKHHIKIWDQYGAFPLIITAAKEYIIMGHKPYNRIQQASNKENPQEWGVATISKCQRNYYSAVLEAML